MFCLLFHFFVSWLETLVSSALLFHLIDIYGCKLKYIFMFWLTFFYQFVMQVLSYS